ncbi:uncharacterized protein UTRI_05590_B [Ustilago trichophora]|uniref:Transmembrane protein n=1 Tax=Ustilago trichophora TaxID=86804 RepID=A0A5C3EJH1_9BASI|nr:uncharacterized protein UTRI_05590_B [Ustilago trichophora]
MRGQLCQCGCGLNAASSSRTPSSFPSSSRKRSATQHALTQILCLETQPLSLEIARHSTHKTYNAFFISTGQPSERVEYPISTGHRRRLRFGCWVNTLFPFVAIMLVTLFCSVSANKVTAATHGPGLVTYTAPATPFAMPTVTPNSTAASREHKQLAAAATTSDKPPNHNINVQVSQPVMCEYMNITFDPSRGTPPYTVMISVEDYWPVAISLPQSYDDASKDLWLYQYAVPTFKGNTTNPSLIVSVTDSTGLMSNSSSFLSVNSPNAGATCAPFEYQSSFYFYTERAASQCQDYDIFWNGSYAPPVTAIFLPELAPPIYVPAPAAATSNMSWQVAMSGGTRFVMTLGDSRALNGNAGVSKLNIVALNEYFSDTCIAQSDYQHRVFAPTTTAAPASIFPDATSTVASLTTSGGIVATVTVIETIKNGRYVHGNGGGGLSSVGFLILMIVVFVTMGLIGVAVGWFCFRRHQKRKHNIKAWDLPNNDPAVPFSADPNMPIAPGVFGRTITRQHSTAAASAHGAGGRSSISGVSNYDPVSLTSRPLTHAPSTRASMRSWTSSAFEHLHLAAGAQGGPQHSTATPEDYALMNTGSGGGTGFCPSEAHGLTQGYHARSLTLGTLSNGSREAWSPTDSIPRTFGFYSDDPQTPDHAGYPETRSQYCHGSGRASSDGTSTKSMRVGPGPTYRPDAASQAAYHDLLANNASPTSGIDRTLPYSATRAQAPGSALSPTSRTHGWAEISEGTNNSTRIVRHADAGLLLDDNDNGDELINFGTGRLMELPPQYDTIHPGTGSQQRPLYAQSQSQSQSQSNENSYTSQPRSQRSHHTHGLASVDISDAGQRPAEVHAADLVDENDDESAFWAH